MLLNSQTCAIYILKFYIFDNNKENYEFAKWLEHTASKPVIWQSNFSKVCGQKPKYMIKVSLHDFLFIEHPK